MIPLVNGKFGVTGAEACKKMVLEGPDGSLCCIPSVDMRRDFLVPDIILGECFDKIV